jgi:hypothetical protein
MWGECYVYIWQKRIYCLMPRSASTGMLPACLWDEFSCYHLIRYTNIFEV